MKYNLTKKISYSIIILVLLVGLSLTAIFGMNGKGYGSAKDINLGLDLAGGVSITYEIKEDNPSSQDIEDTIYIIFFQNNWKKKKEILYISLRNVSREEVQNLRSTKKARTELQ